MTLLSQQLFGHCDCESDTTSSQSNEVEAILSEPQVNPANGLPMIADSMIDVSGNVYGTSSQDMTPSLCTDSHELTTLCEPSMGSVEELNSDAGFILEDDSFNTFSDDSGATDWGTGFSDNAVGEW
ncbi:hypothetical protein [Pseudoalteromonas sp. BDTF-M6]|uniref:hypothetical protein n=1 Tax=Pseudoalteromonas sp. BDTF-M6 TaxID=2796132 RepID=UPI001BB00D84|nr:hypothetical protein [Pseudoalteromonas sp. BDTF-M6]MBS3796371.1 hypothetical protein [Pseudoalteromonas sp. BDTF-M6]